VDELIKGKQEDGQLDECPLTLSEITVLKKVFAKSLSSIHHKRIDYPSSKHLTSAPKQQEQSTSAEARNAEQIELQDMNQELGES
jgi:hypothetical protein